MSETPLNDLSATQAWDRCLDFVKEQISQQAFKTWFRPIKAIDLKDNALSIQVPSKFFYEWLEEHYVDLLKSALIQAIGVEARLVYMLRTEVAKKQNDTSSLGGGATFQNPNLPQGRTGLGKLPHMQRSSGGSSSLAGDLEIKNPFVIPGIKNLQVESQLNPVYTFENFLDGNTNKLARSAGMAIAQNPGGTSFNPFLIFGQVGLGKTHLANAIGIKVKQDFPDKTVLYITAERFAQQYVESVKNNTRNDFIHFYNAIDVLIVDDIQLLSGKKKTQEVFFHIFNHLYQNNKQVILTSDKAPVDIQDIEQRLLSRFKWGLSAELQLPSQETRIHIIQNKLVKEGVEINSDIIQYLAYCIQTNIRELEGALISLIAHSAFSQQPITLEVAQKVTERYITNYKPEISIEDIVKEVCSYFDVSPEDLQTKSRKRSIVQTRQVAMYFAKELTDFSLAVIGGKIGGRDHATVLHACKTVSNLSISDKDYKQNIDEIRLNLNKFTF